MRTTLLTLILGILLGVVTSAALAVSDTDMGDIIKKAYEGDVATLKLIMQENPWKLYNVDEKYGATALHWAIARGKLDAADFLLTKYIDIDRPDKFGRTPLHWAVVGKAKDTVAWLLNKGANPWVPDLQGKTAHQWATDLKLPEIEALLTDAETKTPLTPGVVTWHYPYDTESVLPSYVVRGDLVYAVRHISTWTTRDICDALNLTNGAARWSYTVPDSDHCLWCGQNADTVFLLCNNHIYALDPAKGTLLRTLPCQIRTLPGAMDQHGAAIDGNQLFSWTSEQDPATKTVTQSLVAIDLTTGKEQWRTAMGTLETAPPNYYSGMWNTKMSPIVDKDLVLVRTVFHELDKRDPKKPTERIQVSLASIDRQTGEVKKRFELPMAENPRSYFNYELPRQTPGFNAENVVQGDGNGYIACYLKRMGWPGWRIPIKIGTTIQCPAFVGDNVVCCAQDTRNTIMALVAKTGQRLWSHPITQSDLVCNPPFAYKDAAIIQLGAGTLIALDMKTGAELWTSSARPCDLKTCRGTLYIPSQVTDRGILLQTKGDHATWATPCTRLVFWQPLAAAK